MRFIPDLAGTLLTALRIGLSTLNAAGLTAARTHTLPDVSGTMWNDGNLPDPAPAPAIPDTRNENYTLVLGDRTKGLRKTSTTAYAWTIPPNSSVALPVGTMIPLCNDGTAGNITVTRGSGVTLLDQGSATSADIALAPNTTRVLWQVAADRWRLL